MPRPAKSTDPMVTLQTRIRLSQSQWLQEEAERRNISQAELVRLAMDTLRTQTKEEVHKHL